MQTILKNLGLSIILGLSAAGRAQPASTAPAATPLVKTNEIRLNFRAAPLEAILNYLSDAAGFIIDLRTDLKGKATVWSSHPVTREEALQLLASALDQNGYAAVRQDRTLIIYNKDEARRRNLPVKTGHNPQDIPRTDEMITQIIPVRFINATQVARDLQPLLPDGANLAANEGANALVITDTQANIRRLTEILSALDTAVASVSRIRVFPLKFADAKSLAGVVKELFQPQATSSGGGQNSPAGLVVNTFQNADLAGTGFPGDPAGVAGGGGTSRGNASSATGRAPVAPVVAVAEERSNSLVVSAPEDRMTVIERLVAEMDINLVDVTELRVFRLRNADAQETAELLTALFSDTTSTGNQADRGPMQFGGRDSGSPTSSPSARLRKESRVVAVADPRSNTVVVSAARQLIAHIAGIIDELDADEARKQQVFVFDVQNTDVQSVQSLLQGLFPPQGYGSSASTQQGMNRQQGVGNQLNNRATQTLNQAGRQGISGSFNSGLGGGSTLGGTGQR